MKTSSPPLFFFFSFFSFFSFFFLQLFISFQVRLALPEIESRVVVTVSNKRAISLSSEDLGFDHHYPEPHPDYHVPPYCTTKADMIKVNSLQIFGRITLLLLGSLFGNYLHRKHFHFLPESGIFIILGALYGVFILLIEGQSAAASLKFDPDFLTLAL